MEEKKDVFVITEESLQSKIYYVRGQKVMLDFDLAEIYGYTTSRFNEQVKNNIEKFDADFMFELTRDEFEDLMSNFSTSSWGGRRKLPKAFTEQGIYMLMTVLRGDLAVKQSKALIRTFKRMKDYIMNNRELIGQREYIQLSIHTAENIKDIMKLKLNMNSVEKQMSDIVEQMNEVVTRSELTEMINSFVDEEDNVGNNKLHNVEYMDFRKEYPNINISMKTTNGIFHDRFIVLDYGTEMERVFLCGASAKDAGARITSIVEDFGVEKYKPMVDNLLRNPKLILA